MKKQEAMPCMTLAIVAEAAPAAGATLGKGYGMGSLWTLEKGYEQSK